MKINVKSFFLLIPIFFFVFNNSWQGMSYNFLYRVYFIYNIYMCIIKQVISFSNSWRKKKKKNVYDTFINGDVGGV